jgi:hypothetical protein
VKAVADWKDDLASRLRRAELRFEFADIRELQDLAAEQERLEREVASFKLVARGLSQIMRGQA